MVSVRRSSFSVELTCPYNLPIPFVVLTVLTSRAPSDLRNVTQFPTIRGTVRDADDLASDVASDVASKGASNGACNGPITRGASAAETRHTRTVSSVVLLCSSLLAVFAVFVVFSVWLLLLLVNALTSREPPR